MTDTANTIAKLKRYASCKDEHYQVINCTDIRVLLDEIESRSWRPRETVPDAQFIIIYGPDRGIEIGMYWKEFDSFSAVGTHGECLAKPTHWMPLPSKPSSD